MNLPLPAMAIFLSMGKAVFRCSSDTVMDCHVLALPSLSYEGEEEQNLSHSHRALSALHKHVIRNHGVYSSRAYSGSCCKSWYRDSSNWSGSGISYSVFSLGSVGGSTTSHSSGTVTGHISGVVYWMRFLYKSSVSSIASLVAFVLGWKPPFSVWNQYTGARQPASRWLYL